MKLTTRATAIALGMLLSTATLGLAQKPAGSDDYAGRHGMDGTVTKVDSKKGWIHLKTNEGTMIIHFPPADLANVKKGDQMSVDLALKKR